MRALAKVAPGADRLELLERPTPSPAHGEVLIQVAAAGVCGSDIHLQRGTLPLVEKEYPVWMGHEYAGTVVAVGQGADPVWIGRRVTAEPSAGCGTCELCTSGHANLCPVRRFDAGGFAAHVTVPVERLHRLADDVPFEVGALAEPLACAVHGLIEVAHLDPGDVCVVIGPGPLGLLTALVAEAHGAVTVVVGRETSRLRLDLARSLDLATIEIGRSDPLAQLERITGAQGADLVVGCAGGSGALATALAVVRPRGTYLELALGSAPALVHPDIIALRELRLMGSVGHTPTAWRRVMRMLGSGAVPVSKLAGLVTASYPLSEWSTAFAAAAGRGEGKVLLRPSSS